jgi:hypothetical protein
MFVVILSFDILVPGYTANVRTWYSWNTSLPLYQRARSIIIAMTPTCKKILRGERVVRHQTLKNLHLLFSQSDVDLSGLLERGAFHYPVMY